MTESNALHRLVRRVPTRVAGAGILTLAQENAKAFMESLLTSLGYTSVTILQATPVPAP